MRALLRHSRVEPVVSRALLARCVRESTRFFIREQRGSDRVASYRVRSGRGALLTVQHRCPDVQVIDEIFYQGLYEPPAPIAALLEELGADIRVLDLGGNVGMFGTWLAQRTAFSSLCSFEPDDRNANLLQRTIDANINAGLLTPDKWALERAAAGNRDGEVRFATGEFAMSHVLSDDAITSTGTAVTVPMRDVLAGAMRDVDLVKMDIEGGEWELLADPRFPPAGLRVVVLEYHPDGCPTADPHTAAREQLERHGFTIARVPQPEAPAGVGMAWAWR